MTSEEQRFARFPDEARQPAGRGLAHVLLVTAAVLCTAPFITGCGGDSSEPSEDPPAVLVVGADAEVTELGGRSAFAEELAPGVNEEGPVVEIEGRVPKGEQAVVSFSVPADFEENGRQLMVATREQPKEAWRLLRGKLEDGRLEVRVSGFSVFGLVSIANRFLNLDPIKDIRGRIDPPSCPTDTGLTIEVDEAEPGDPFIYACPARVGDQPAARVYNNRSIGMGYILPDGAEARAQGSALSEAAWNTIYGGLDAAGVAQERILPAGGEVTVIFPDEGSLEPVEFYPTNQALALDVFLALLPDELLREAPRAVADLANCIYSLPWFDEVESFGIGDVLGVWSDCGRTLAGNSLAIAGAFLAGAPRLAQALIDQFDALGGGGVWWSWQ